MIILGYHHGDRNKPIHMVARGTLVTQAFINCSQCGAFISSCNGPALAAWCPRCTESVSTPCDGPSEGSNAPERPLTASQHRKQTAYLLMNWMDKQEVDYEQAADMLDVSTRCIITAINGGHISSEEALHLSNRLPELDPHLKGVYNA